MRPHRSDSRSLAIGPSCRIAWPVAWRHPARRPSCCLGRGCALAAWPLARGGVPPRCDSHIASQTIRASTSASSVLHCGLRPARMPSSCRWRCSTCLVVAPICRCCRFSMDTRRTGSAGHGRQRSPTVPARPCTEELQAENVTAHRLAARLDVSIRTLHRTLAAEGTSYRRLLDQLRLDIAGRHLTDDRVSVAEVAFLAGFSELSAFHRAFKRWTGRTPAAFRARRARVRTAVLSHKPFMSA